MKCKALTNGVILKNGGNIFPCCVFEPNVEWKQVINVRTVKSPTDYFNAKPLERLWQDLDSDVKNTQCNACWRLEATGGKSWRMHLDEMLDDSRPEQNMLVAIRLGNACNFRCYMCWPPSSSKIQADWNKLASVEPKLFREMKIQEWTRDDEGVELATAFLQRAKFVSIMGGEPFYNKHLGKFLDIIKTLPNIVRTNITTNGSIIPYAVVKEMPNLNITFSIDAVGPLSEYCRFDSSWDVVSDNFEWCLRNMPKEKVSIACTLSLYNIFGVQEAVKWATERKARISINFVDLPKHLSIANLHPDLVEEAIVELKAAKALLKDKQQINHALQIVGSEYTPEMFADFITYTQRLDTLRQVQLPQVVHQYTKYYS